MKSITNQDVMITGSNGFVGKHLCDYLKKKGINVIKVSRSKINDKKINLDFSNHIDWTGSLLNVKCIIHTAAKVHILKKEHKRLEDEYDKINYFGSINLAKQAAKQGVKRFIYLSTAKVGGEDTKLGYPMTEETRGLVNDPYSNSKLKTEKELFNISKNSEMEVVVIRPPLVYGPNVKANFYSMIKWLNRGIPLPFDNINNKRSLIFIENLSNFIYLSIDSEKAKNQIFLVSDDEDISTSNLLKKISIKLNIKNRLFYLPSRLMFILLSILGRQNIYKRLYGSLQLDISKAKNLMNWKPIISMSDGLDETISYFKKNK